VQAGGEQVGEVEATMARIARSAAAMNQLLAEIASGAAQQREGVAQVGASVQELDGLTQRNVALVERSVASAQALQQESGELVAGVERFKLPEGELLAA
jgi:methyl-accepting chemotaxis protein